MPPARPHSSRRPALPPVVLALSGVVLLVLVALALAGWLDRAA